MHAKLRICMEMCNQETTCTTMCTSLMGMRAPTYSEIVEIDAQFHCQLEEEEQASDISTFLALPKIIPARQRRHQQPLLDFFQIQDLDITSIHKNL